MAAGLRLLRTHERLQAAPPARGSRSGTFAPGLPYGASISDKRRPTARGEEDSFQRIEPGDLVAVAWFEQIEALGVTVG